MDAAGFIYIFMHIYLCKTKEKEIFSLRERERMREDMRVVGGRKKKVRNDAIIF